MKTRATAFTDARLRSLAEAATRTGAHIVVVGAFSDAGDVLGRHEATLRSLIANPDVLVETPTPSPASD